MAVGGKPLIALLLANGAQCRVLDRAARDGEPTAPVCDLSYETKIIESIWTRRTVAAHLPGLGEQAAGVRQGVAAIAPLRTSRPKKFTRPPATPPLVGIDSEDFVIMTSETLVDSDLSPATTRGAALDPLAAKPGIEPAGAGPVHGRAVPRVPRSGIVCRGRGTERSVSVVERGLD